MGNQNGPQPQGPPMQPPGSPPRPPCYNQQMPYNTDPMYYNLSMYGPVEGAALYTDTMDIPNNNPYIEVYVFLILYLLKHCRLIFFFFLW